MNNGYDLNFSVKDYWLISSEHKHILNFWYVYIGSPSLQHQVGMDYIGLSRIFHHGREWTNKELNRSARHTNRFKTIGKFGLSKQDNHVEDGIKRCRIMRWHYVKGSCNSIKRCRFMWSSLNAAGSCDDIMLKDQAMVLNVAGSHDGIKHCWIMQWRCSGLGI